MEMAGCKKAGYTSAFEELVDKGFLIPVGDKDENGRYTRYEFREWGKAQIYNNG